MITRAHGGTGATAAGYGVGGSFADSCVTSSGVLFAGASDVVAVPYSGTAHQTHWVSVVTFRSFGCSGSAIQTAFPSIPSRTAAVRFERKRGRGAVSATAQAVFVGRRQLHVRGFAAVVWCGITYIV